MVKARELMWFSRASMGLLWTTVVVILWGGVVRATRSGAGCRDSWPSCNGTLWPALTDVAQAIEWTHRLSSGVVWLASLGLWWWARRFRSSGHPIRRAAGWSFALMCIESLIGAAVVLLRLVADNVSMARAAWVTAHLVNTFLLLAALTSTCWWSRRGLRTCTDSGHRRGPLEAQRADVYPSGLLETVICDSRALRHRHWRRLAWLALVGTLCASASGALTALCDTVFPADPSRLVDGQQLPADGLWLLRWRIIHPFVAILGAACCLFYVGNVLGAGESDSGRGVAMPGAAAAHEAGCLRRWAMAVGGLVLCQIGLGSLNVMLGVPVAVQIAHLALADLLWMAQIWLLAELRVRMPDPASAQASGDGPRRALWSFGLGSWPRGPIRPRVDGGVDRGAACR